MRNASTEFTSLGELRKCEKCILWIHISGGAPEMWNHSTLNTPRTRWWLPPNMKQTRTGYCIHLYINPPTHARSWQPEKWQRVSSEEYDNNMKPITHGRPENWPTNSKLSILWIILDIATNSESRMAIQVPCTPIGKSHLNTHTKFNMCLRCWTHSCLF